MNICLLCRDLGINWGGTETFVIALAQSLAEQGHQISVVCQENTRNSDINLGEGVRIYRVSAALKPFIGYNMLDQWIPISELYYSWILAKTLRSIVTLEELDIIEDMDYFRQGFFYAQCGRVPIVMRLHGWFLKYERESKHTLRTRFIFIIQSLTIRKVNRLVAVSRYMYDCVTRINWIGKIHVTDIIHNSVDVRLFKPGSVVRHRCVLFSARMTFEKGAYVLADAIPMVLAEFPDVEFHFVGKDTVINGYPEFESYLKRKAPKENIKVYGQLSQAELILRLQSSLIFVMPSQYESFGLAVLEAMACGCAVVATSIGGLMEVVDSEIDGLLVRPNDPKEVAEAIGRLLKDDSLRARCASAAVLKAEEKFSPNQLVLATLNSYSAAIGKHRKRI